MDELLDLGFVGVTDNEGDARKSGNFFRGSLGVAAGDHDARGRIGGVNLANGVAGLRVGCGGNRTSIEDNNVGGGRIGGRDGTLFAKLPLDGCAIGLSGAAAELLDEESAHEGDTYLLLNHEGTMCALRESKRPIQS